MQPPSSRSRQRPCEPSPAFMVFENKMQQRRGGFSPPHRLDHGEGRGKPAPTSGYVVAFISQRPSTPGNLWEKTGVASATPEINHLTRRISHAYRWFKPSVTYAS